MFNAIHMRVYLWWDTNDNWSRLALELVEALKVLAVHRPNFSSDETLG